VERLQADLIDILRSSGGTQQAVSPLLASPARRRWTPGSGQLATAEPPLRVDNVPVSDIFLAFHSPWPLRLR
jgi:hypothetical protein